MKQCYINFFTGILVNNYWFCENALNSPPYKSIKYMLAGYLVEEGFILKHSNNVEDGMTSVS